MGVYDVEGAAFQELLQFLDIFHIAPQAPADYGEIFQQDALLFQGVPLVFDHRTDAGPGIAAAYKEHFHLNARIVNHYGLGCPFFTFK